jgi:hypothetical protein
MNPAGSLPARSLTACPGDANTATPYTVLLAAFVCPHFVREAIEKGMKGAKILESRPLRNEVCNAGETRTS